MLISLDVCWIHAQSLGFSFFKMLISPSPFNPSQETEIVRRLNLRAGPSVGAFGKIGLSAVF